MTVRVHRDRSTRRRTGLITTLAIARVVAASAHWTVVAAHAGPVAADVVSALLRGVVTGFVALGRGRVPPTIWGGVARSLGVLARWNTGFVQTVSDAVGSRARRGHVRALGGMVLLAGDLVAARRSRVETGFIARGRRCLPPTIGIRFTLFLWSLRRWGCAARGLGLRALVLTLAPSERVGRILIDTIPENVSIRHLRFESARFLSQWSRSSRRRALIATSRRTTNL